MGPFVGFRAIVGTVTVNMASSITSWLSLALTWFSPSGALGGTDHVVGDNTPPLSMGIAAVFQAMALKVRFPTGITASGVILEPVTSTLVPRGPLVGESDSVLAAWAIWGIIGKKLSSIDPIITIAKTNSGSPQNFLQFFICFSPYLELHRKLNGAEILLPGVFLKNGNDMQ